MVVTRMKLKVMGFIMVINDFELLMHSLPPPFQVESIGGPSFEGSTFDYDMSLSCGSGALNGNRQCQTKTLAKLVSLQERIGEW